jgi:hypothetical protein
MEDLLKPTPRFASRSSHPTTAVFGKRRYHRHGWKQRCLHGCDLGQDQQCGRPAFFADVFNNSKTITGVPGCAVGNDYIPNLTDDRTLQVSFNDGSGTPQVIPNIAIKSVPFSKYATSLKKWRTFLVRHWELERHQCQVIQYNSATQSWELNSLTGSVSSVGLELLADFSM